MSDWATIKRPRAFEEWADEHNLTNAEENVAGYAFDAGWIAHTKFVEERESNGH